MSCFDSLPTVDKCCCCIPLRVGTLIIAILCLLGCFNVTHAFKEKHRGKYENLIHILNFVVLVSNIILFIFSIILICGAIVGNTNTATWWLYAVLQNIVVALVYIVLCFLADVSTTRIITFAITALLWLYFVIVVNSFRQDM